MMQRDEIGVFVVGLTALAVPLVEVDGFREYRQTLQEMLHCTRGWLRSVGSCPAASLPPPRQVLNCPPFTSRSGPWSPAPVPCSR
jgi:hypothetical protein